MKNILSRMIGLGEPLPYTADRDKFSNLRTKQLEHCFNRCCKKTSTLKAAATHRCGTCEICVAEMDHHCPWVNNCVGFYNQKYFLQFLVYVFLGSFHAISNIAYKAYPCIWQRCALFDGADQIILGILSLFMGLVFGIFVCVMFYDQMECILTNQSTIDQLQIKRGLVDADV